MKGAFRNPSVQVVLDKEALGKYLDDAGYPLVVFGPTRSAQLAAAQVHFASLMHSLHSQREVAKPYVPGPPQEKTGVEREVKVQEWIGKLPEGPLRRRDDAN